MITQGCLCIDIVLCAYLLFQSLTPVTSYLLDEANVRNLQPNKRALSIASIGPANMWSTGIHKPRERITKNRLDHVHLRQQIPLSKNEDKIENAIDVIKNGDSIKKATEETNAKQNWQKEFQLDDDGNEDTIVVGQATAEKWQEKHDSITDFQHIINAIKQQGKKDGVNILPSIGVSATRTGGDENRNAHLKEWQGTYENIKNTTSEKAQLKIATEIHKKENLENELKLLDVWRESHGQEVASKPEYKLRKVMHKVKNYADDDDVRMLIRNGQNLRINNVIIDEILQIWNEGGRAKSREKQVTNIRINGTLFDNKDAYDQIGPLTMWHRNGKRRYENILFSKISPLGIWKVREKKRESIGRPKGISHLRINSLVSSLNMMSMWSSRSKMRKSIRESRIMGAIDSWDTKKHNIGSIL